MMLYVLRQLNPTRKDVVVDDDFGGLPKSPIVCKPFENAFEQAFKVADVNPRKTLFFDDSIRNLQTAKALGLQTALVGKPHRPKGVDLFIGEHPQYEGGLARAVGSQREDGYSLHSEKAYLETCVRA